MAVLGDPVEGGVGGGGGSFGVRMCGEEVAWCRSLFGLGVVVVV